MVPRSEVADCQRAKQTLHTENARLQDQVLVLQTQNRDYADRAVDDSRRLAAQEETIDRLRQSTLAYQNDISRLEAAFHQLTANLGGDFGTSTTEARAWPRSGRRSASAADKNESGNRSPNTSGADDGARLR
jgi:hypothetical protein